MSHTISARNENGFKVEVFAWDGGTVHSAWYQDREEAHAAAHHWERLVTLSLVDAAPVMTMDEIFADMDSDDLLRELLA